jgi:hypothetical protein
VGRVSHDSGDKGLHFHGVRKEVNGERCPLCAKSRHSALRKETSLFFTDDRLDKESLPLSAARLQTEGLKIKDSYSAK